MTAHRRRPPSSRRRRTGTSAGARSGRRGTKRQGKGPLATGLIALAVLAGCAVVAWPHIDATHATAEAGPGVRAERTRQAQRSPGPSASAPSARAGSRASASPSRTALPEKGSGRFVTAQAGGGKVGQGPRPLRYVVQVETGLDISPTRAANEIADILAAPRGWTRNPAYSFQLVSAGAPHDLTVRIATPGTADALCWAGIHQNTRGEYNCEVPGGVVVNLRRWVEGSPTFDGPIHDYRALIINHEMGHFLGYSHMTCAGPGQPAPVMMQQIKGLHGCVANAWPYDKNGRFVSGPHVQ